MKKFISIAVVAVMMLCMLAACGEKAATPDSNEPYKIALIAPLTGSAAEHGASYKNAIEYKLAEINAAGGVNGHQIVCDFYDDKGDSKESVTVASLVAEKKEYLAVFGPFSSTCAIADAPTFEDAGIVQFAPSSSHADFTGLGDYMASYHYEKPSLPYLIAAAVAGLCALLVWRLFGS